MAPQPTFPITSNMTSSNNRMSQPRQLPINALPQTKRPHRSKSRWHFGIRSKCPAWEVMLELYRSLQNVGMVKKTITRVMIIDNMAYSFIVGMENFRSLPFTMPL